MRAKAQSVRERKTEKQMEFNCHSNELCFWHNVECSGNLFRTLLFCLRFEFNLIRMIKFITFRSFFFVFVYKFRDVSVMNQANYFDCVL